jgi:hypothetical protein
MPSMRFPFSVAENIYKDFLYTLVRLRDVKLSAGFVRRQELCGSLRCRAPNKAGRDRFYKFVPR